MPFDVVVLGSANVDVVLGVRTIPSPGETVLATGRADHPGGKGLNQAVAAARCGARTAFVGALGLGPDGDGLLAAMHAAGVDTSAVRRVGGPSGSAFVVVAQSGENLIVVDPGANAEMSLGPVARTTVAAGAVLVAQLEIPVPVVIEGARRAQAAGATVLLNAAPARPLSAELLDLVDVLVVNEHEALTLTGGADPDSALQALSGPARDVVVTRGARGAAYVLRDGSNGAPPGRAARVVDTTGAGDAFVGALAAAVAAGWSLPEGVTRAVAAGAIAVERAGAVPSMPTAAQIDDRLRAH